GRRHADRDRARAGAGGHGASRGRARLRHHVARAAPGAVAARGRHRGDAVDRRARPGATAAVRTERMSGPLVAVLGPATVDELELEDGTRVIRPGGTPHYAGRALRAQGAGVVAIETGLLHSRIQHTAAGTEQSIMSLPEPLLPGAARALLPQVAGCSWVLLGGQTAG